jgi:RNA polymerase sigma-70 factor (ECF subfamily)
MKIRFTNADGEVIELEISSDYHANLTVDVTTELGTAYQESLKAEESNDRANTRRHTSLDIFTYEDARYFGDGTDIEGDLIDVEFASIALAGLTEQQRRYVRLCVLDGWSYSEVARREKKDESAVRRSVSRALAQIKKNLC